MNGEAGKGDDPRNCFSEKFRNNYSDIDWRKKPKTTEETVKTNDNPETSNPAKKTGQE